MLGYDEKYPITPEVEKGAAGNYSKHKTMRVNLGKKIHKNIKFCAEILPKTSGTSTWDYQN